MSTHSTNKVLLTGVSGYLGGTVLARLKNTNLPPCDVYCLVRNKKQAEAVRSYGGIPIEIDISREEDIKKTILDKQINIVFYLIDAMKADAQAKFIKALGALKQKTGQDVWFLHTSGAKLFSEFAGHNEPLDDDDPDLYNKQKNAQSQPDVAEIADSARGANCTVIEQAEAHGVKSIIFVPCIVYGRGQGFGNKISIQTVAIVKAAKQCKRVYKVDEGRPVWPVAHVEDTADLYIAVLKAILKGQDPPHGKNGYYLASSGSVAWIDLYQAMAKRLYERGVIDSEGVTRAGEAEIVEMAKALGAPPGFVRLQLGGQCLFAPKNGSKIGWKAQYRAGDILESAADEVDLILENL